MPEGLLCVADAQKAGDRQPLLDAYRTVSSSFSVAEADNDFFGLFQPRLLVSHPAVWF